MLHKDEMIDAFRRTVQRRAELPPQTAMLIGEAEAISYETLQDQLGRPIHGETEWTTLSVPEPAAKLGAAIEEKLEPLVPDALDQGEKPFIRPFMVEMADDHYALDTSRARELLGWAPKLRLAQVLPALVASLKKDPATWYERHGIAAPAWVQTAAAGTAQIDAIRTRHEAEFRNAHRQHLWAHFFNVFLGIWLIASPPILGLESSLLAWSDTIAGIALVVFAALSLSWRLAWARWVCAAIGARLMSAQRCS